MNLATAFPGARVEASHSVCLDPPSVPQRVAITRRRPAVRAQVTSCTRCPLHTASWVTSPVPFSGPTPARFAIVGEAPGQKENRGGEPFIGPAGRLLREMVHDAGLDITSALIVNTVSCYPSGTPEPAHVAACRPNLTAQLELAGSPFTILAGGVALSAFRPDLKVSTVNGSVFIQGGRIFMPVLHPAYILRNRAERSKVVEALEAFRHLLRGDLAPAHLAGGMCAAGCGGYVEHYDPEMVPFCAVHWERRELSPTERARQRAVDIAKKVKAARKAARANNQGGLL